MTTVNELSGVDVFAALRDPDIAADPYPFLARLREHSPVHRNPVGGVWFVTRHADAVRVLRDPLFHTPDPGEDDERFARLRPFPTLRRFMTGFVAARPQDHMALRRTAGRYFTPHRAETLRTLCAHHAGRLLDPLVGRLRDGGEADLHTELVYPYTWNVISDVMGVPEDERATLTGLALPTIAAFNPSLPEADLRRAEEAATRLGGYFTGLLERARGEPPTTLAACAADLPPDQAVAVLWVIWAAGYESTVGGIGNGVLAMLDHLQEAHFLGSTPERADAFVTECLRHDPPIWGTGVPRAPREPLELGGVTVPVTADLRVLVGAANRDPAAFPDPDRFDPGRFAPGTASLTFGHGPHYCLGAALARTEMATLLTALRRRLPGLALASPPRRRTGGPLRGFESITVTA